MTGSPVAGSYLPHEFRHHTRADLAPTRVPITKIFSIWGFSMRNSTYDIGQIPFYLRTLHLGWGFKTSNQLSMHHYCNFSITTTSLITIITISIALTLARFPIELQRPSKTRTDPSPLIAANWRCPSCVAARHMGRLCRVTESPS